MSNIKRHSVHQDYGCDCETGDIYSFKRYHGSSFRKIKPRKVCGYLMFDIHESGKIVRQPKVHQFCYECYHQVTPTYSVKSGDGLVIHHLNENKLDNRICNLELTTHADNSSHNINQRRNHKKGKYPRFISCHKQRNKFQVQIKINKKQKHFGLFSTLEEAITRRNKVCQDLNIQFVEKDLSDN